MRPRYRSLLATFAAIGLAAACGDDGTSLDPTEQPGADGGAETSRSDGSSGDAPTSTGDGSDPNTEPLGCDSSDVVVCDGFDAPSIDPSRWEVEKQHGALAVDSARALRGGSALHVTLEAGGGRAMLRAKDRVRITGQHVWGRTHMFVPASVASSLTSHSNVVAFGGKNSIGATAVHAVAIGARSFFGLYFQDDPMIDESSFVLHPDVPITNVPLDRWFCLEWELDGVARAFRLYLDGAVIPSSVIEGRDPPAEADVLVGAEFDLAEAWLDEVVVARRRVGCLR